MTVPVESFPIAYRWFLLKGLCNWEPWSFVDSIASIRSAPDLSQNEFATRAFKQETGADFDVYLFARRHDMDDYAFFVVEDGTVQDKVVSIHLSFARRLELKAPLQSVDVSMTFAKWIRSVALPDVIDWMSEDGMNEDES